MNLRVSLHALLIFTIIGSGAGTLRAGTNQWTNLGPYGGAIKVLAIDPQNTNTMYAGTYFGIFKTIDGAATWMSASAGLPANSPFITGLAIDPQNTSTMYAWGGNFPGLVQSVDGAASWHAVSLPDRFGVSDVAIAPDSTTYVSGTVYGANYGPPLYSTIFKSRDGAASWKSLALTDHFYPRKLAIDLQSPSTIYLGGYVYDGDPATVYSTVLKTADGGATWTEGGRLPGASLLVLDPGASNTLYAGGDGIWKSTDGGTSWSAANNGLPDGYRAPLALAADPRNPGTIYAVIRLAYLASAHQLPQGDCCAYPGSIFKSADAGASWTEVNSGAMRRAAPVPNRGVGHGDRRGIDPLAFDGNIDGDLAPAGVGLAVDHANPGTVYVGTNSDGVFKSTDSGTIWRAANTGLSALRISAIAVDSRHPDTIYAAGWTRLFKSEDGGLTWRAGAWGVPGLFMNTLAMDPQDPSTIYAGLSGTDFSPGTLLQSTDGGSTWRGLDLHFAPRNLAIDPQNTSTVYAGASWYGLYKTSDQGRSWTKLETGFIAAGTFAFDPHNLNTVYAAGSHSCCGPGDEVYRSEDGGLNWASASTSGLPDRFGFYSLLVEATAPSTLYAGVWDVRTQEVDIYRTDDGAASWKRIGPGNPTAIDPQNGIVYAGIAGSLFRSTDRGASWSNTGLPGPAAGTLAFNLVNPNTVYAAGSAGVFSITFIP
jgi:photosystem II stability/assembly factor-like uncharacterized protein